MPQRPTRASSQRFPAAPPRIVIEQIQPVVDGGAYAVKRLVGDDVAVTALVYREGHDLLAARIRYRAPGERRWRVAPMRYERDFDRCSGSFRVDRIGEWGFTVEAWTDHFGSWRAELGKKVGAGQEVTLELEEGAAMLDAAARRARSKARTRLTEAARLLRHKAVPATQRAEQAMDPALHPLVLAHLPPDDLTRHPREFRVSVDRERAGFAAWYEMFPRSQAPGPGRHGTFADAARRLPRLAELGFDVIYLPPIHPVGRTNRKGKNNALAARPGDPGSPWAIGNEFGGHTAVEPALGTLDDFRQFVKAAGACGMEVALDYALQCSPDHPWVREHPQWFFVRPDGSIKFAENPPKKYEDIVPLNFWCDDYPALWRACRDIFLFWVGHGVRCFRVDNPHTKPFAFWEWVIREVRRTHPDVIFLSEAFTRPARMMSLAKLGFTQSYTYFTWRNSAWELREYLTELTQSAAAQYFRPNFFTNTPDILHEYLQQGGRPAFRIRLLLAATLSPIYGIYSGFELCENLPLRSGSEEYLNSEKYEIRVRDWEAPGNINDDIARINRIRRENPALQRLTHLRFLATESEHVLAYHKHAPDNDLLVVVNLDPHSVRETMVHVPLEALGVGTEEPFELDDLLTGARYEWRGSRNYIRLDPAEQPGHVLRRVGPPRPRSAP